MQKNFDLSTWQWAPTGISLRWCRIGRTRDVLWPGIWIRCFHHGKWLRIACFLTSVFPYYTCIFPPLLEKESSKSSSQRPNLPFQCAERLSNKSFSRQIDQIKNREEQTPLALLFFIHWLRTLHPAPDSTPAFLILACFDHESTVPRPLGDDYLKLRLEVLQNCLQVWATHFNLPVWCLFSSARGWKAGVLEGIPDLRSWEFCLDTSERRALFLCFYKCNQWERDRRLSITLLTPLLYSQKHRLLSELFSTWKRLT